MNLPRIKALDLRRARDGMDVIEDSDSFTWEGDFPEPPRRELVIWLETGERILFDTYTGRERLI